MATMDARQEPAPIRIDSFYGINEAVGETEIKVGEWVKGYNFRVTKNMKPQKRPGHHTFIDFESAGNAQGIWEGQISGKNVMIVAWGGNVYEYDMDSTTVKTLVSELITDGVVTVIGTITDVKTEVFWFNSKIYFLNGTDYKQYDGTTYKDVTAYVPTVSLNSIPGGGGTLFQEVNLLTGAKKQTFIGDGTSVLYQLAEAGLGSDLLIITVDGVTKAETTDFTVNRTTGQVTFSVAPLNEAYVFIEWVKVITGNADLVKNNKYVTDFGVNNDTNLFIFGNVNSKNTFRFSAINKPGYFPANSFVNVGSNEFGITDMKPNQQSLLVYKENSTKIVRPSENTNFYDNSGLNPYNFGYMDLNENIGNLAPKMVQLVEDSPVSLYGFSMWLWEITNVESQRSANIISDRLKLSLQVLNLANAVTFNYSNQKEYWVNVDDIVYIWNYGNNTMYKYSNIQGTEFIGVDKDIFYTSNGTVERMNEDYQADGMQLGDTIPCKIYGGFSDFNSLEWRKIMRDEWFSIAAASRTSCKIGFMTDKINEHEVTFAEVEYKTMDFDTIDFNDFSFLTNLNAQPNRIRIKVKKFTYLSWIFENDTNNESLTILKLLMKAQTQGLSK